MQNIKFNFTSYDTLEVSIELPLRVHGKEKKISYMETNVIRIVEEKYGKKVKEVIKSNNTIANYMSEQHTKGTFIFKLDMPKQNEFIPKSIQTTNEPPPEIVQVVNEISKLFKEEISLPLQQETDTSIKKGKKQKKEEVDD